MKRLLRDTLIRFFHYSGIAFVYRTFARRHGPLTRVIVFHDIPSGPWFASLIEELTRVARVLTPHEFTEGVRDQKRLNVLVTFDDGYESWITHALPVLGMHGIRGLFFINSGMLDACSGEGGADTFMRERLKIRPRAPLTWEGARLLMVGGHTVGGHARSHENLSTLRDTELRNEIESDKKKLEAELRAPMVRFAYPFGTVSHFTPLTQIAVKEAGYTHAYSAISRFDTCSRTFSIPRMCIEDEATPRSLRVWVGGSYDLFDMLKQKLTPHVRN